jgi:hypothetical protein
MNSLKHNVLELPKIQIGFAQARTILRDLDNHDADQIDAAFEVLIYSPYKTDLELCEAAADYMWARNNLPQPSGSVILVIMAGMVVSAVALAAILVEALL